MKRGGGYSDLVWTEVCRSSLLNPYPILSVIFEEKNYKFLRVFSFEI